MVQRIVGLIVCLVGWFIAVLSTQIGGFGGELAVVLIGVVIAGFGSMWIVNGAHLKDAIWKA
jgi:multisubunit Na+/H+ antiporter MnhG subunit